VVKKNEQVDPDFQDLFLRSKLGPKVLGKIVDEVHFMEVADDEEWQSSQNVVKIIMDRCGIGEGITGLQYVKALAGHKLENTEKDEGQ